MSTTPATFYFTVHPGDLSRKRIIPGASIMIVASALWQPDRQRFMVRRPPADHIGGLSIDSGGFTAARRWGRYPWTPEQYIDWIRATARDAPLDFCASMDYACERDVNRESLATNQDRIRATQENELRLRAMAPDLPWLGVLQGNTLTERITDVRVRRRLGLLANYMGIGSICGRLAREAATVIRAYGCWLPKTRFHGFGLDARTGDGRDDVALLIRSWDSASWSWAPGAKGVDRPVALHRSGDESWSDLTLRIAQHYMRQAVLPRVARPRQLSLTERGA